MFAAIDLRCYIVHFPICMKILLLFKTAMILTNVVRQELARGAHDGRLHYGS